MRTLNLPTLFSAAVAVSSLLLAAPLAVAQPAGYGPPPRGGGGYSAAPAGPPGYFYRQGLMYGGGVGIGGMSTDSGIFKCQSCNYKPAALGIDGHIGAMIDPRTAIMVEGWGQAQTLDVNGNAIGSQGMLLVAVQRWLAPQFWIKGGLGLSSIGINYADGYQTQPQNGWGFLAAGGYEIFSSPNFAIDLQLRIGLSSYDVVNDRATVGMAELGFNWFQ